MNDATELKRLRAAIGATQAVIAERLGVSLRNYNRWERGALAPRTSAIELMRVWAKAAPRPKTKKKRGA